MCEARLVLDTRHGGLTVPASVVQQGPKGPYAYVIEPDNTVEIRPITVAQISDGQALIDSGLTANEQIVVDGQYKLQPGTHVTILHGRAAEQAAAQSAQQAMPRLNSNCRVIWEYPSALAEVIWVRPGI
jgi:membrane fusion protein, multidrug efflux system